MVELPLIILSAAAVFASGAVFGVTGFGFVIVASPVLVSYLDPTLVVPVLIIQADVLGVILLALTYKHLNVRRIVVLMIVGSAFTPLGALLLVVLDESTLKVLLGAAVGITAAGMLIGFQRPAKREQLAAVPVGVASGILTGATGLSAAPVILFFANQGIDPREFRANIVLTLLVMGIVVLPSFFVGGVLTSDAVTLAAQLLPASLGGAAAGLWLSRHVSTGVFRRIALVVVLIAAGGAIASGALGL